MEQIRQSWWHLSTIQIGAAICLPVIMIGQMLASSYGMTASFIAIMIGNAVLFVLGCAGVSMSLSNRANTIENAIYYFGQKGAQLFAITMIISLIGWFAIQLTTISFSVQKALSYIIIIPDAYIWVIDSIIGVVITLVALRGIQALDQLATLSMPLLIMTMLYTVYNTYMYGHSLEVMPKTISLKGISLVLVTAIGVVADMPTYYRFARSKRDGLISIAFLFLLMIPAIEMVGVYIGTYNPGTTVMDAFTNNGTTLWCVWVALFFLLAGWTTNNANLYSASIALEILLPSVQLPLRIMCIGLLGTLTSCFISADRFEFLLEIMSMGIVAMSAVIITQYVLPIRKIIQSKQMFYLVNGISWCVGICVGIAVATTNMITLTTLPSVDVWIASMVCVLCADLAIAAITVFQGKKI